MSKNETFVPLSLNNNLQTIKEELEWIEKQMIDTYYTITMILISSIEKGQHGEDVNNNVKENMDFNIRLLVNELQEKGTENSLNYYRKLEKYSTPGKVNAVGFMQNLVTSIQEIGIRINNLEQALNKDRSD